MRQPSARWHPLPAAILAALVGWALLPVAYLVHRSVRDGLTLTGAESVFGSDQLQYLAWARSLGAHGLAANGFDLTVGDHVFFHPMFALSGLAWRAGVALPATLLLWAPVAAVVLFAGFRAYVARTVQGGGAQAAALWLALFFQSPAYTLLGWPGWPGGHDVTVFAGELAPTGALWGYLPAVIAMGLMPVFLLAVERLLDERPGARSRAWYAAVAATSGMLASWLHPWQGETLLLIVAMVVVWSRGWRRIPRIALPLGATAAPLLYYALLARVDTAWDVARLQTHVERPTLLALAAVLTPFAVGLAARRRGWDVRERILYVWPVAALGVYLLPLEHGYFLHALEGMSLPLAVLAVRGWHRLGWPAWAGVAALAACSLPGLVYTAHRERQAILAPGQAFLVTGGEAEAMRWLESAPGAGGVLASPRLAAMVPGATGRRVWMGHPTWTPDFGERSARVAELFDGRMTAARARRLVRRTEAGFAFADCSARRDLRPLLGPLVAAQRTFGCATLYVLRVRARPARL